VARSAAIGREEQENRHRATAWAVRCSAPRRPPRSRRRRRVIPRRRLVTDQPNSPHLQASKTKAQFLIAVAANDDQRAPTEKDVLKETFAKANLPAEIEVYTGAAHGWCPPDSGVYNEPQAEKRGAVSSPYGKALA
jgi:dienelactone hydrolase